MRKIRSHSELKYSIINSKQTKNVFYFIQQVINDLPIIHIGNFVSEIEK